jgi:hypothetical protein
MSYALVLLMAIDVVLLLPRGVPLPLLLYPRGRGYKEGKQSRLQHDPNQDSISTYLLYIYSYRYNYLHLGEHAMVI